MNALLTAEISRTAAVARLANLFVPGCGLLLLGHGTVGVVVGVVFAAAANLALAGRLLFPDEVPWLIQNLAILAAATLYIVSQWLLIQAVRGETRREYESRRRDILGRVADALRSTDGDAAWRALGPLQSDIEHDLLIAYRAAQILDLRGDAIAAREAWARVRRLDRHRVYG
ncbi:MAG: hypothetical protein ACKVS9_08595 [Phycisphaerae bacterium]